MAKMDRLVHVERFCVWMWGAGISVFVASLVIGDRLLLAAAVMWVLSYGVAVVTLNRIIIRAMRREMMDEIEQIISGRAGDDR